MPSQRTEFSRRAVRWLGPVALVALTPKCVLCVLAYAGLGVALGLGGPELCGSNAGAPVSWTAVCAWLGLAAGLGAAGYLVTRPCPHAAPTTEKPAGESSTKHPLTGPAVTS